MAVCLPKINREALLEALKKGEVTIERLYKMSEAERRAALRKYVGEELSSFVDAKFEQAMLSNQKAAFANWIKRNTTFQDPIRRDMLKKVENVEKFLEKGAEKEFMEDLAELKLGFKVSEIEAKTILEMKNKIDELRVKVPEDSPIRSAERLEYGFALDAFKTFIGERKLAAESLKVSERFLLKNFGQNIVDIAGITKSLVATLDNSFIGRQGIKTLLDGKYSIWATTAKESFLNFGRELKAKGKGWFETRDDAIMSAIRADIFSRPNALNGKYRAAKNGYGLEVLKEEVFPSAIPERIPLIGRIFKASETAFNGSAIRMRADLADAVIRNAERNGVDMLSEVEATAHGRMVSSMTGRGDIGKLDVAGKELNVLLFSIKFLKSNIDTLTAHLFDKKFTSAARAESAKSLLRISGSIAALLTISKLLDEDSVDFDPRSSKFGKICKGNNCYDITGGMRGLVTLGSRIVPTFHDGEWGFWTKSASTGKYTKMTGDSFGERTAFDTIEDFMSGKFAPAAAAVRDIWKGQKFGGEKPTFVNTIIGLITPISLEMLIEELQKGNDDIAIAMIAESLGISPTERTMGGFGKRWGELKEKVDTKTYNDALKQVTERFNERVSKLEESSRWKRMDNDERNKELDKIKREETERIFGRYGI